MNTTVDGEFQRYATEDGAYIREHFFGPDPRLRKLVEHLSDDELRALPRGGHDYRKLYAAYKAATEQVGAPTVILAKTVKGWTLGAEVEGRNATHQIKKLTNTQLRALRERLYLQDEIPEEALADGAEPPYFRPPEDSPEYRYLMDRRQALDGSLPRRVVRDQAAAGGARRQGRSRSSTPGRATRRSRPPRRSPGCCATCAATASSASGSCRSSPTRPAPSAWTPCSRSSASTPSQGQLYEPVDHNLLLSYMRGEGRPDPRGGHHRGRVAGVVDRRRHQLRHPRRADGAVLHLLLDVRLPAGRRPHLAGRRRPRPGLPPRRHRRAHHAARRGPPAPGRPQPDAGLDRAGVRGLRPRLRLRDGGDHPRRHRADVRRQPRRGRGRLLLPDPLQRELPDAGRARGRRPTTTSSRASTAGPPPPRASTPHRATILFSGHRPGRGARPPPASSPSARRRRRPVVGHVATSGSARRPSRPSGGTACTPTPKPRDPARHPALGRRRRADRRRDRLHAGRARPDQPVGARAATPASAPTASAASDTREALRRFFETDAAAHRRRRALAALAEEGEIDPRSCSRPPPTTASTATSPRAGPGNAHDGCP